MGEFALGAGTYSVVFNFTSFGVMAGAFCSKWVNKLEISAPTLFHFSLSIMLIASAGNLILSACSFYSLWLLVAVFLRNLFVWPDVPGSKYLRTCRAF